MWRNTQRENRKDNARRARIFYLGVALVVLWFIGQLVGSLGSPFWDLRVARESVVAAIDRVWCSA